MATCSAPLTRRPHRILMLAGIITASALVSAAPAAAVIHQKTLSYSCAYPDGRSQPVSVETQTSIPAVINRGAVTDAVVTVRAIQPEDDGSFVGGWGDGQLVMTADVNPGSGGLPVQWPVASQELVSEPVWAPHQYALKFELPAAGPESAGTIALKSFAMSLQPIDEIGEPVPGVPRDLIPCTPSPTSQSTEIATFEIGGSTPTPTPTVMPTPTPTPIPQPIGCEGINEPTQVDYKYSLAGSATLKTLVKGSLPLTGSINAKLGVPSGCFKADLLLNKTSGNLTALGFLPVTAQVVIVPTEKVTGRLTGGVLTANAKFRIKPQKVTLFGVELAGGANCQAKQVSSSVLKSTQPTFFPLQGGPIAGTFAISDLANCGALTGIVSPLTAGKGNAILLNLTPNN